MSSVPGLRSPYAKVGRLVYFGRMVDKIRLHGAGKLPAEYAANLGEGRPNLFDARCCRFLRVTYKDVVERTMAGGTDNEILEWAHEKGGPRSDDDCLIWNGHMTRLGWRDETSQRLQQRVREYGLEGRSIETFFDMIDVDEGRSPGTTLP
jgi:gluconokinase